MNTLPSRLFGVTVDNVTNISLIVNAIKEIKGKAKVKPVVRIVFDFDQRRFSGRRLHFTEADFVSEAESYKPAVEAISKEAFVMGELIDSSAVYRCHFQPGSKVYVERTKAYAKVLGSLVDIWEIGNEVNGEWVGWDTEAHKSPWEDPNVSLEQLELLRKRIATEIKDSFAALKSVLPEPRTALTFYFNDDFKHHGWTDDKKVDENGKLVSYGERYSILKWVDDHHKLLPKVDYVLVSYYEDDNPGLTPNRDDSDVTALVDTFKKLSRYFPKNTSYGFGEFAPQCQSCDDGNRNCDECVADQVNFIGRYYRVYDEELRTKLSASDLTYIGGYFYWYFKQDAVNNGHMETVAAFRKVLSHWD